MNTSGTAVYIGMTRSELFEHQISCDLLSCIRESGSQKSYTMTSLILVLINL
ncbi:hypothetical protein M758_1G127000 [Ceratodon purpureus]|uniref:Uncharacterized protein n=1 Tax=Ceratodon purpureus TaxID=3225 RepID=A0A8T0J6L4_CERPU|nr:hypothetical protein KC19_1G131400 [Ceratodon purpureus]KAG0629747.1 hypothetical protein M758_1G127000 [Ceratodon purpureus]